jgi:RNA polymerase-binding transcription factor DksA
MKRNKKVSPYRSETARASSNDRLGRARFVLINPDAQSVFVAGSFNNWNPGATPLKAIGQGHWVLDLAVPAGRYEYQFVIDGRWIPDASAKDSVMNPFGGINSVLEVTRPQFTLPAIKKEKRKRDPKWSWHYRVLTRMRDRLIRDSRQLIAEASETVGKYSMHMADSASDESDHDMAIGELKVEQATLYEVEQALERIENGTYGKCALTGKPILPARLRAVPWAQFSEKVAEALEGEAVSHSVSCP